MKFGVKTCESCIYQWWKFEVLEPNSYRNIKQIKSKKNSRSAEIINVLAGDRTRAHVIGNYVNYHYATKTELVTELANTEAFLTLS